MMDYELMERWAGYFNPNPPRQRLRLPDGVRLYVEPRDLWVGAFVKKTRWVFVLWLCFLPCLPLRLHWIRWSFFAGMDQAQIDAFFARVDPATLDVEGENHE